VFLSDKIKVIMLGSCMVFSLTACQEEQQQAAAQGPVPVTAVTSVTTNMPLTASFVGKVTAYDKVDIRARVQGYLKENVFVEGDLVKKDSLLFIIEQDQYKTAVNEAAAALASAQASASNAEVQFKRAKELIRTGDVSQSVYDQREAAALSSAAAVKQAKAALDNAKLQLGYTEIKAPFTGKIGLATYSAGEYVTPSSASLAQIVSVDPIGVEFSASMKGLSGFMTKEGKFPEMSARIVTALGKEYPVTGEIDYIGNMIDKSTDTLKLRAKFANPDALLIDGETVRITISTKYDVPTVIIPQIAIQQDQAGRYVMIVGQDNKVEMRRITTGKELGKNIVVTSGVKEGEKIVTEGLQKIKQGVAVNASMQTMDTEKN